MLAGLPLAGLPMRPPFRPVPAAALDTGVLHAGEEEVQRHPGFRLFATQNPASGGFRGKRERLSPSLLTRFQLCVFEGLPRAEWEAVVRELLAGGAGGLPAGAAAALAPRLVAAHLAAAEEVAQQGFPEQVGCSPAGKGCWGRLCCWDRLGRGMRWGGGTRRWPCWKGGDASWVGLAEAKSPFPSPPTLFPLGRPAPTHVGITSMCLLPFWRGAKESSSGRIQPSHFLLAFGPLQAGTHATITMRELLRVATAVRRESLMAGRPPAALLPLVLHAVYAARFRTPAAVGRVAAAIQAVEGHAAPPGPHTLGLAAAEGGEGGLAIGGVPLPRPAPGCDDRKPSVERLQGLMPLGAMQAVGGTAALSAAAEAHAAAVDLASSLPFIQRHGVVPFGTQDLLLWLTTAAGTAGAAGQPPGREQLLRLGYAAYAARLRHVAARAELAARAFALPMQEAEEGAGLRADVALQAPFVPTPRVLKAWQVRPVRACSSGRIGLGPALHACPPLLLVKQLPNNVVAAGACRPLTPPMNTQQHNTCSLGLVRV